MSTADITSATGISSAHSGAVIEFRNVTKRYPGQDAAAVADLSFTVPAGAICCLVGPSGGGKTTTMMMVNRLIDATDGDILIDGRSVRDVDETMLRRNIGYVIQETGLFPHMTVGRNIATIPRLLGWSRDRIRDRVTELLELVRLGADYARRYPAQLSGGQRQRVGLARALAAEPAVMLMDEPFGALDPITRANVQDEFLRLQATLHKTVLFVTHDVDEAIKMGDRIAVLRSGGVLAQYSTGADLLEPPVDDFVADFVGADRGLKRLALRRMRDVARRAGLDRALGDAPTIDADASLRVGLSRLFTTDVETLVVRESDGTPLGTVTLDELHAAVTDTAGTTR